MIAAAYNLALAYEHLRRYDEALKWVKNGLKSDPRDPALQRLELRVRVLKWRSKAFRVVRSLLPFRRSVR